MKIYWKITGKYQKNTSDGKPLETTSLQTLITDIQGIATNQYITNISKIHQSFGLNFLPSNVLTNLIDRYSENSLLTKNNICPLVKSFENLQIRDFTYHFIPESHYQLSPFNLDPQDSQIPENLINICDGIYQIDLENTNNNPILDQVKNQGITEINKLIAEQPLGILHDFINKNKKVNINLSNNCQAVLTIQELPDTLQEALGILQTFPNSPSDNPLVTAYQERYDLSLDFIPEIKINNQIQSSSLIFIQKGNHRQILSKIIDEAQQFLLISSYRLEDEEIVRKICEKSQYLPQGVWILTDFSDAVQDRVDANMNDQQNQQDEYANSDEKKKECLRLLSQAKIGFRSGNFHLKTYISEKSAYLGSCNLTGGSLDRNREAGLIWQNTQQHQLLIDYFSYLWYNKTTARALPFDQDFRIESLVKSNSNLKAPVNSQLLNSYQYERDFTRQLQHFSHNPQGKILILTRNFNPTSQQVNLLSNLPCQIYYGNYNQSNLTARQIPYLHGKIVVVGNQVAYIGSQDCAFSDHSFFDLTYKTTNPQEITTIVQQLSNFR